MMFYIVQKKKKYRRHIKKPDFFDFFKFPYSFMISYSGKIVVEFVVIAPNCEYTVE